MTLEISRDRTTAAETLACDTKDPKKPKCPIYHKDGDKFLHRTPNDACQKMVGKMLKYLIIYGKYRILFFNIRWMIR